MKLKNIFTDRLELIPITLEITKDLMTGSNKEIEKLGIKKMKNGQQMILWIFCQL